MRTNGGKCSWVNQLEAIKEILEKKNRDMSYNTLKNILLDDYGYKQIPPARHVSLWAKKQQDDVEVKKKKVGTPKRVNNFYAIKDNGSE